MACQFTRSRSKLWTGHHMSQNLWWILLFISWCIDYRCKVDIDTRTEVDKIIQYWCGKSSLWCWVDVLRMRTTTSWQVIPSLVRFVRSIRNRLFHRKVVNRSIRGLVINLQVHCNWHCSFLDENLDAKYGLTADVKLIPSSCTSVLRLWILWYVHALKYLKTPER